MKFYVILPTTGRSTLKAAIDSVKNQTYQDFEILVVQDTEIREDHGAWARNQALSKIRLESTKCWITYIDDDDVWLPDHLETMKNIIDDNPDVTMVRTAGRPFWWKHRSPRSTKKIKKYGPPNIDDILTVGIAHKHPETTEDLYWLPEDNHDHTLWRTMLENGGVAIETSHVTFEFER